MKGKTDITRFGVSGEWPAVSRFILPSEATGLAQGREPQHHLHSTKHLCLAPTLLRILSQKSSPGSSGRQHMQGVWGFSLSLSPGAPEDAYWTIHFSPPADIRALSSSVKFKKAKSFLQTFWLMLSGPHSGNRTSEGH